MTRTAASRRVARSFGLRAELQALALLLFNGYRILARRYQARGGEIDLIVMRGRTIAFVEVKARSDLDRAHSAITEAKRRRLSRAAKAWTARQRGLEGYDLRCDAVFVAPWRRPRHVVDAFRLDERVG